jgi:hypothetical protein
MGRRSLFTSEEKIGRAWLASTLFLFDEGVEDPGAEKLGTLPVGAEGVDAVNLLLFQRDADSNALLSGTAFVAGHV